MIDTAQLQKLLENENARNMSRDELASTFIQTDSFRRLLTPKNHVVIGARGSGKTALAKMLSHDHLSRFAALGDEAAAQIIASRSLIGTYISTKTEWVGSLKNKIWNTNEEKEEYFRWRLNLAACAALLATFRSCLDTYVPDRLERLQTEQQLVDLLGTSWLGGDPDVASLLDLQERMADLEYHRSVQLTHQRVATIQVGDEPVIGAAFELELFAPLKRGIRLLQRLISFPEGSRWIVCIDEAEFLDRDHHRILNSHMRSDSQELVFKITTTPYHHLTLDTNLGSPLRVNDDFSYVYIDQETVDDEQRQFAETLFQKLCARLGAEYSDLTLRRLLGDSYLLESKSSEWTMDSPEMAMLRNHATPALWRRAEHLYKIDQERFRNEIARKVHGLMKLRDAVRKHRGNQILNVYSGEKMIVRCGDGNPRRLLRMLKALLQGLTSEALPNSPPLISPETQSERLIFFASDALARTQSEPGCGRDLYEFLKTIGEFMEAAFHSGSFTGDVVSAFEIDDSLTDDLWELIESGVEAGFLFPVVNRNNADVLPVRSGRFHLANVLAPRFRLLPRRGKPLKLRTVLSAPRPKRGSEPVDQLVLWESTDG